MTEQDFINYFLSHPIIPEYTISDTGVIHIILNQKQFDLIPQEIKNFWDNASYYLVIRVGYPGWSNSSRHDSNWKTNLKATHLHRDYEYIEIGALPCHYYCDTDGETPLSDQFISPDPNTGDSVFRTNPSRPTQWRQNPVPLVRLWSLQSYEETFTPIVGPTGGRSGQYSFYGYGQWYDFLGWRDCRCEFDQPYHDDKQIWQTYRFGLNLTITIIEESAGDHPRLTWAYPPIFWETEDIYSSPKKWLRLN